MVGSLKQARVGGTSSALAFLLAGRREGGAPMNFVHPCNRLDLFWFSADCSLSYYKFAGGGGAASYPRWTARPARTGGRPRGIASNASYKHDYQRIRGPARTFGEVCGSFHSPPSASGFEQRSCPDQASKK